jgi:hypothetical protein
MLDGTAPLASRYAVSDCIALLGGCSPGTGPFGSTCQSTQYRWCGKRSLKFVSANGSLTFP